MRTTTLCVALLLCGALVPAAGAAGPSEECDGAVTNATIETLCDRVEALENETAALEERNSELRTDKAALEGELQELEYQLNNTDGFSSEMTNRMKEIGAWDPYADSPALILTRETGFFPIIYQYVGPGNGEHSFNGMNAWERVAEPEEAESQIESEGSFSFTIMYGTPGMNTTYTADSMGEYRRTVAEITAEMNSQAGFAAWANWNNDRRQSAESTSTRIWYSVALLFVGGLYGAARVESSTGILEKRLAKNESKTVATQFDGRTGVAPRKQADPTLTEQLEYWGRWLVYQARRYKVPVGLGVLLAVGWVVL